LMACDAPAQNSICPFGNRFRARDVERTQLIVGEHLRHGRPQDEVIGARGDQRGLGHRIVGVGASRDPAQHPAAQRFANARRNSAPERAVLRGTHSWWPSTRRSKPHQVRGIQSEAGDRLVEPLRLIVGAGCRLLLNRKACLAEQVDAVGRTPLQHARQVGPPHRRGGVAARQEYDRRTVVRGPVEPVGAHRTETRWHVERCTETAVARPCPSGRSRGSARSRRARRRRRSGPSWSGSIAVRCAAAEFRAPSAGLLDGDGLGQVSRLVDVVAAGAGDLRGEHLQGNRRQQRLEER
jgi:hypothetical protein